MTLTLAPGCLSMSQGTSSFRNGPTMILAHRQMCLCCDVKRAYAPGRGRRGSNHYCSWDQVILEALRIFRARTEGASLDTVPEVTYSVKPSCDGRANKSVAQRGIMGFEPRAARHGYIYNPERNPNVAFLTDLPIDQATCLLPYDQAADVWIGKLEADWIDEMEKHIARAHDATATLPVEKPVAAKRKNYMCPTCLVPQKGHTGPAPKKRKGAVVTREGDGGGNGGGGGMGKRRIRDGAGGPWGGPRGWGGAGRRRARRAGRRSPRPPARRRP